MIQFTSNHKSSTHQDGIVTLEMLIAMVIIILSISVVILVMFGNQTSAVAVTTNNQALYLAQLQIENARANSTKTTIYTIPPNSTNGIYKTVVTNCPDLTSGNGKCIDAQVFNTNPGSGGPLVDLTTVVPKVTPTITISFQSSAGKVTATATITGVSNTAPTGTISFFISSSSDCSSSPRTEGTPALISSGAVTATASSNGYFPLPGGTTFTQALYSGDSNYASVGVCQ